jgi:hypothetical protein
VVIKPATFVPGVRRFLVVGVVVFALVCGLAQAVSAQESPDTTAVRPAAQESPDTTAVRPAAQESPDTAAVRPVVASEPVAGFDPDAFNPFFIQDPTATFRLSIGAYAQIRYEINSRSEVPDSTRHVEPGWILNRARLFFEGRYTDDFDFRVAINVGSDGEFELQQAYFKYYMGDIWQLWFGQQFYNSMREDWPDPTQTASMDNSAVDYTFALGTAFGAFLHRAPVGNTRWWLAVTNGAYGSKREFATETESDVMLFGRVDYQVAGDDWWVWDDLIGGRGYPFAIMMGIEPGIMFLDSETPGQSETAPQVNADVSVNGDGYQAMLAGVWTGHFPEGADSYNHYGVYFQAGYFFKARWQGYVRYDFVSPGDQPGDFETYNAPGLGVNFFPLENRRWRFSAELNHLFGAINNTIVGPVPELGWLPADSGGQTSLRFQTQFGF